MDMYVRNNIYDYMYICAYNYINVYLRLQVGKHVHLSHCIKKNGQTSGHVRFYRMIYTPFGCHPSRERPYRNASKEQTNAGKTKSRQKSVSIQMCFE